MKTGASTAMDVLFSWIHLSDIHFGCGDAERKFLQELVLQKMSEDIAESVRIACPKPEAIFVTGDIAFSGAIREPGEYDDAKNWILTIAKVVGLGRDSIYCVPGNHDVQREADAADEQVGDLVKRIRSDKEKLDNALASKAALLRRRQANYLSFAKDLAPACLAGGATPEAELFWSHERATKSGLLVRIVGLNTAILAANDEDRGNLQLGRKQVALALKCPSAAAADPTVRLLLSHHPFTGGWLADEKDVSSWAQHTHIHLCGHVHEADARQVVLGGGSGLITVTAGASYGEASKDGPPARHGYNIAALVRDDRGELGLAVWPRLWSSKNTHFLKDVENMPKWEEYSLNVIPGVTVPPRPPKSGAEGNVEQSGAQIESTRYNVLPESASAEKKHAVLEVLKSIALVNVLDRTRDLTAHEEIAIAATDRTLVGEQELSVVARAPEPGKPFREETTKMSLLWVPPGKFWMGSSKTPGEPHYDEEACYDELPPREVTLSHGFWIGEHPVTNAQYLVFMEATGARAPELWRDRRFNAVDQPLVGVDWEESLKFAVWLTAQAKLGDPLGYRLPTEAEWEYAARGTDGRKYPWGNEPASPERADYGQNLRKGRPTTVGTHPAGRSPWGLQDIAGGVWEWCLDGWQDNFAHVPTKIVDPCHLAERGAPRVVRGGSWINEPKSLRCVGRSRGQPERRMPNLGFRIVCGHSREYIGI
jgi:formylglycine-generating enzyme required for sulfatase activity